MGKKPYRRGVGIMLINRDGLIFVARRLDTQDAWQMPQGGINKKEKPKATALREMKEEIGSGRGEILGKTKSWLKYDLPPEIASRIWKGKYRGQKQRWFAIRFTGEDRDIDLNHTDHPEFDAWKWVPVDELLATIVPFKRDMYKAIIADLGHFAKPAK
jgi:putative (di)nucleoside polyphosphate hydrolase